MGRFFNLEVVLVFFIFLVDSNKLCVFSSNHSTSFVCNDGDRETLLKFHKSVTDPSDSLSSWENTTDCCKWTGIGCNTKTGRVVRLDLRKHEISLSNMSSCLVELKYLEYLDLSGNRFDSKLDYMYGNIPEFLGLIERLTYLNLSRTKVGFQYFIPRQLENLTNLEVLDLSYTYEVMNDLGWMSRLSSLKHLDMSGIELNGARNLWQELSVLPSLSVLGLSYCLLDNTHFSPHRINSTFLSSIQELYIGYNTFTWPFPPLLENMTSLRVLDVSGSLMNVSIPVWLGSLKSLEHLHLSYNNFVTDDNGLSRMLPSLCHLKSLYLDYTNNIQDVSFETNKDGPSMCMNGYDLEILNMKNSGLNGYFPDWLVQFNKLTKLDLSQNMLHGHIPAWIGNLLALKVLDLSNNTLNGDVPESIGQLSALKKIDLSSNLLQGEISTIYFLNLTKLKVLRIGSNQISTNIVPNWVPSFQLTYLDMGSCKIIGNAFPQWLESQKELETLIVSNATISGPLPKWFQGSRLFKLDLSHNQITGPIPHNIDVAFPKLGVVQLSHNMFNGTIPSSFCKMRGLDTLDLSYNHLTGNIPKSIGDLKSLESLDLSYNELSGNIPEGMSDLTSLAYLNLFQNNLSGKIPSNNQLQTLMNASIYLGNPKLCGDPLPNRCLGDEPFHEENKEVDDYNSDKLWFYMAFTLGYAAGIWVVIWTLMLKKKWRYAYFRFADDTIDRIYVTTVINYARLKKKLLRGNNI